MKNAAALVERAIDRDFLALLLAQNRVGASLPLSDVLHAHAIPQKDFDFYAADPTFEAQIQKYMKELNEQGFGVEQKAAVLHEMGLPIVYDILRDPDQPASARLEAHKMLGDIAGKSKSAKLAGTLPQANGFQLIINIPGQQAETLQGVTLVPIDTPTTDAKSIAATATTAEYVPTRDPVQLPLFGQDEYDAEAAAYEP